MVGWKLMQEVGVYSLALQIVFKFGPKLKRKKRSMVVQPIYIYTPGFLDFSAKDLYVSVVKKKIC